jgi:putative ABC transport system substrate-binding protein
MGRGTVVHDAKAPGHAAPSRLLGRGSERDRVRRREVIALLGAAAASPRPARAQQVQRIPRIGVLVGLSENDPGMKPRLAALREELEILGWMEGHNLRIDRRYAPGGAQTEALAQEVVALQPDVILAHTVSVAAALQIATRSIPIVFVSVGDPLGAGFISSLARPGGNLTGLMTFEAGVSGKWVAMLREAAPRLARALFIGNSNIATYAYYLSGADAAARALALELMPARMESVSDLERSLEAFARVPGGGLVVAPDLTTAAYGDDIVALAGRHGLPAVYAFSYLVAAGGLMSYGTDRVAEMRQAASYLDRILRGAAPADLPVQTPTKFETAINLRTAKALGLMIPQSLLIRADQVIE